MIHNCFFFEILSTRKNRIRLPFGDTCGFCPSRNCVDKLAAQGIVTEVGGAASHAAVVSRELGRVAVVGCGHGVAASLAGKQITVDGYEGEVREGNLTLTAWSESDTPELRELAELARRVSPLRAHAAGDHPRLDDSSDTAVRAAVDSGKTDVVSSSPLIVMLAALRLAGRAAS